MIRIGHGFDVHKFGGEGPVIIGGVSVPYEQGLIAHSDGDVALHALCDALLGSIAAGDIGRHFPDTDDEWKGADSRELLKDVYRRVKEQGYVIGNARYYYHGASSKDGSSYRLYVPSHCSRFRNKH